MTFEAQTSWAQAALLLSLRIGPVLVLAPPFSQIAAPLRVRVCLVLALSGCLVGTLPPTAALTAGAFTTAAATELLLGLLITFGFQLAFASLSFAGRALDVQAGYGLALVIDPGSKSQSPLFGTVFTLVAGLIFFACQGHLELMHLFAALLKTVPVGQLSLSGNPGPLIGYFSLVMGLGIGAIAAVMATLFLIDLCIAYLSRALPQMNALMLGLQVKTIATLAVLALSAGLLGPVALRLVRSAIDFVPSLGSSPMGSP